MDYINVTAEVNLTELAHSLMKMPDETLIDFIAYINEMQFSHDFTVQLVKKLTGVDFDEFRENHMS